MANAKSSTPSAFPPIDRPLPPFPVTTRDGKILTSVEEVAEHLLQADRLSERALERLLGQCSNSKETARLPPIATRSSTLCLHLLGP